MVLVARETRGAGQAGRSGQARHLAAFSQVQPRIGAVEPADILLVA